MFCATAPDTSIDNLEVYTDEGDFGASITVNASNVGITFAANATPDLADLKEFFQHGSGDPMDLDIVDDTAITATGFNGDILKLQMVVEPSAGSGTLSAETVTFSYDEI